MTVKNMREQDSFIRVELADAPVLYFQGEANDISFLNDGGDWYIDSASEAGKLFGSGEVRIAVGNGTMSIWTTDGTQDYTLVRE